MLVAQLSPTLCDPTDCNPPCFSALGISQAWILEWVDIPFSRGFFQLRDWTQVFCIACRFFIIWATKEALYSVKQKYSYPVIYSLLVHWKRKAFLYCSSFYNLFSSLLFVFYKGMVPHRINMQIILRCDNISWNWWESYVKVGMKNKT